MTNRADNFNRADTTNAIGTPSDGGSAWSQVSGTWGISSNTGYCSVIDSVNKIAALEASVSDADVQVTAATAGADFGLNARLVDDNNHLLWIWTNPSSLRMFKKVAGSYTQLGSTITYTAANGDIFKFSVSGSTLNGYVNGTLKVGPITDSAGSTNTQHGLREAGATTTARFDDFSITGTGGGGTPPTPYHYREQIARAA